MMHDGEPRAEAEAERCPLLSVVQYPKYKICRSAGSAECGLAWGVVARPARARARVCLVGIGSLVGREAEASKQKLD